jgi:hypothetical protein
VLFPDAIAEDQHRGRMAPSAAVGILLLVLGWLALARGRRLATQVFATLAFGEAMLALLVYLYGGRSAYAADARSGMALLAAGGLMMLSLGLLAAVPGGFLPGVVRDPEPPSLLLRHVLPVILVGLPLIGWFRIEGERRGTFDNAHGVALMTVVACALLFVTVWRAVVVADRTGSLLRRAWQRLGQADADLAARAVPNRLGGPGTARRSPELHRCPRCGLNHQCTPDRAALPVPSPSHAP